MTLNEYLRSRGLTIRLVSQQMGVSRQALCKYGIDSVPSARTLGNIASAMTALGAETTVADLVSNVPTLCE